MSHNVRFAGSYIHMCPLPNTDRHDSGPGWGTDVLSARSPQIMASSWMENMAQILVLIRWAWPLLDMARLTPLTCVLQKKKRCGAIKGSARCSRWTTVSPSTRSHKRVRSHFLFGLYACVSWASHSFCRVPIEKSTIFLSIYDAGGAVEVWRAHPGSSWVALHVSLFTCGESEVRRKVRGLPSASAHWLTSALRSSWYPDPQCAQLKASHFSTFIINPSPVWHQQWHISAFAHQLYSTNSPH